jgi:carboxyl-terminal processing protease
MNYLRVCLSALLFLLVLSVAFSAGYLVRDNIGRQPSFTLLNEAYEALVNNGLYSPPPAPALEYGMIHGMVNAYQDPYTIFVEPAQHEIQSDALHGSFGGIGAQLGRDKDGYHVIFPFPDGPANKSGIQESDRLLAIDNLQVTREMTVETIQSAIRGPVGEKVKLMIARPPDYFERIISVERAEIAIPSVTWWLDTHEQDTGIIKVNLFAASTPEEVSTAIEDLIKRKASKFVLDLRDNPGGLLTAGVDVARLFLKTGVIMHQEFSDQKVEIYKVEEPGHYIDFPMAVLINQNSASAAEITAGALKGHKRAQLIGLPSFGKDTVQYVIVLSDQSSLHVTAARWWIPYLGNKSQSTSLQPDILVEPSTDPNIDKILRVAVQSLHSP